MSLYDEASLVMIPSGYKDDKLYSIKPTSGDGDFTFSRDGSGASPATRVNSAGLIEKGRTNLLTYSNTFSNAAWSKSSSITFTSGQSGYDGTNDGWTATPPNTTGNSAFYQNNISNLATSSIYAKYNGYHLRIRVGGTGGNRAFATFDLQNGSIGNSGGSAFVDANIQSIGNGWYRCSLTKNYSTAGFTEFQISENATDGDNPSWTPNGTDGVYVQDAQLEKGLVATSYIETTTAAASAGILGDMPRLDYSGGASCPALLLEPLRTNRVTQSELFNIDTAWLLSSRPAVESNVIDSPEGLQNGSRLTFGSGNVLRYQPELLFTNGYSYSIFVKKDVGRYVTIYAAFFTTSAAIGFDLDEGTCQAGGVIEPYGDDWYRISVSNSVAGDADKSGYFYLYSTDTLGSTSSVNGNKLYVYGAQIEEGSYATSYVPTYGSATARAQEGAQVLSVSNLIGQTEGTLFAEVDSFGVGEVANRILGVSNGTSAERIIMLTRSNGFRFIVTNSSSNNVDYTNYTTTNGVHKLAMTYDANEVRIFVDGVKVTTDSSVTLPSSLDSVHIGKQEVNGNYANNFGGSAKQALLFTTALTDAECISLTT
jgi:hypothetical protein